MYATVIDGIAQLHEGVPTLEEMQRVVGGYIETAERFPTATKGITADVYCNEDGIGMDLPVSYWTLSKHSQPICGNLVIVGGNDRTGASVALNERLLRAIISTMGLSFTPTEN